MFPHMLECFLMKTTKGSIEKNKRKRIPLGCFCGYVHIHTHTYRVGERESTSPHIGEITATWSGTLSIMLGPLKPHRCPLTCPKISPLLPNTPCGHSSGHSEKHQNKTHPRGEILSACPAHESAWRLVLPTSQRLPLPLFSSKKRINYNSKRWTHLFSLSPGKRLLHSDNLIAMTQCFSKHCKDIEQLLLALICL